MGAEQALAIPSETASAPLPIAARNTRDAGLSWFMRREMQQVCPTNPTPKSEKSGRELCHVCQMATWLAERERSKWQAKERTLEV